MVSTARSAGRWRRSPFLPGALSLLAGCQNSLPTFALPTAEDCRDVEAPFLPVPATGALEAGRGLYLIEGEQEVTYLRVEAGVVVCGAPGAELRVVDSLVVEGTAERPVIFTAMDTLSPWGGVLGRITTSTGAIIVSAARVEMTHAVVEHASHGVTAAEATLESVRVRSIRGAGLYVAGRARDLAVDTVCVGSDPGSCTALGTVGNGRGPALTLSLEDVVIRAPGGHGLMVDWASDAVLAGVRIEAPAGSGIVVRPGRPPYASGGLTVGGPVSVQGQGGYLVEGWAPAVADFLIAYADSVRSGDRVRSVGGTTTPVTVPPEVTWIIDPDDFGSTPFPHFSGGMTLLAGSRLETSRGAFGPLVAMGTAERPVHMVGVSWSADPLTVGHVLAMSSGLHAAGPEAVVEDLTMEGGTLRVDGPRARLERIAASEGRVIVDGAGATLGSVNVSDAPGHGIEIGAGDVLVQGCSVTGSAGDGVHVTGGGGVVVRGCNLFGNDGAGVWNDGLEPVLARGNWWGDPAGPEGPLGDGVGGPVDASEPLSEPAATVARVASVAGGGGK